MTESDLGPLSWVKGEIDLALARAGEALARALGAGDREPDREQLRLARNHVHQAHGALDIVDLAGVSVLTEAIERSIEALEQGKANAQAGQALEQALSAVRHYLDGLLAGEPDQALKLFPYYRALLEARGETEISASDLFFPDLALRPPRRESTPLPVQVVGTRIKAARLGYERGLLKWLKGDAKGLREMRNSLAVIEQVQTTPAARALWWAAMAVVDAIAAQAVPIDAWLKKLLGRIGRQVSKWAEGIMATPDRLLRDVLYVVAIAGPAAGEHAACVRAAWQLDDVLPKVSGEIDLRPSRARLRAMREPLEKAMDDWNRFCAGTAAALPSFHEHIEAMAKASAALDLPVLQRLLQTIEEIVDALRRDPLRHDETLALEMATGLLLLEQACNDDGRLGDDFGHQVAVVCDRLAAWAAGRALEGLESPHWDKLAQRAQEKLLRSQVAREILANLATIEQTLDAFFREPGQGLAIASLEKLLHQVSGALLMLGEMRAREVLEEAAASIARFAAADFQANGADFEAVATKLSALALFVERLQFGSADIDALLAPKPASARPTVGEEIAAARPQPAVRAPLDREASPISVSEAVAKGSQATIQEAPPVAAQPVSPTLPPCGGPASTELATPMGAAALGSSPSALSLTEAVPAAKVSPLGTPSVATPPAERAALDAELREIFVEEGSEMLGTLAEWMPRLHDAPRDREALTMIRRAYHTLKGSGRMVGLTALGEAAWAVEQTLNQVLQRDGVVDAELLGMLDTAQELFGRWIERLRAGDDGALDASALIETCTALREGRALAVPLPRPTEAPAAQEAVDGPAASPTPTPALPPESVQIGEMTVSSTLYRIYLDEAAGHLATLSHQIAQEGVPAQPSIRAAHTLAGISGSTGFRAVQRLAHALEIALARFASAERAPQEPQRQLLTRVVEALAGMIGAIAEQRAPTAEESLFVELEALRPDVMPEVASKPPAAFSAAAPASSIDEASAPTESEGSAVTKERPTFELPPLDLPALDLPPFEPAEEAVPSTADETRRVPASRSTGAMTAATESAAPPCAAVGDERAAMLDLSPSELARALDEIAQSAPPPSEFLPAEEEVDSFTLPPLELALELEEPGGPVAPVEAPSSEVRAAAVGSASPAGAAGSAGAMPRQAAVESLPSSTMLSPKVSLIGTPLPAPASTMVTEKGPRVGHSPEVSAELVPEDERRQMRLHDDLDLQLLPLFLEESDDLMPAIDEELRAWRHAPHDEQIASQIKRLLHTLKGSARMAGAMGVGELVHAMESRLERALASKAVTPAFLDDFEASFDRVALLLDTLRKIAAGERSPVDEVMPESAMAGSATSPASALATAPQQAELPLGESEASARALLRVRADQVDRLVNEAGEMAIVRARIESEMRSLKASLLDLTENVVRLRNQLREIDIQAEMQMSSRETVTPEGRREFDPLEFDRFTRFQELTRMMAESVGDVATIQQNLLANLERANAALAVQACLNRELSQALMSIRMVPLSSLAERLHRIVRQTAKEMNKRANLDIRGGQTELDRSVLEHITSPLEHLLRNAVAHGLEPPDVRRAAGKPEIGEIVLSAAQEGNEMVITLHDDGAGLNLARIREKAIAQGLIATDEQVDEQTLIGCIFQSGFSTASRVSAIAGRGVGLDVVKTEVGALGGRLEVATQAGQGTTFRIWLPLTLAVTQALLVKVAAKTYAIPSAMVEQASEMKPEDIAQVRAQGFVAWLDRRYPWYYLPRLLGEAAAEPTPARRHGVLLLKGGQQSIALEVDELLGNEEIVVKNIGPQLARVPGIAGATVLPDGEIVLILNPIALAARVQSLATAGLAQAPSSSEPPKAVPTAPVILVVDDSLTVRKITSRLLSREGYEVITAKDGQDAIEKMADFQPDVVLTDIEMPRMDGFELTRHIRNDQRLERTPIIMITSRLADKHKNVARELGVDHYLGKPYDEEELLRLVAECASRHPALKQSPATAAER